MIRSTHAYTHAHTNTSFHPFVDIPIPPSVHTHTSNLPQHTHTTSHPTKSALTPGRKRTESEDYDAIEVPERWLAAAHGKKKKVGDTYFIHVYTYMCVYFIYIYICVCIYIECVYYDCRD